MIKNILGKRFKIVRSRLRKIKRVSVYTFILQVNVFYFFLKSVIGTIIYFSIKNSIISEVMTGRILLPLKITVATEYTVSSNM